MQLFSSDGAVAPGLEFEGECLMRRRAEYVFDLVRGGEGMQISRGCGVAGGMRGVGCSRVPGFVSGRISGPGACAQRCSALVAGGKSFRLGDGFVGAMVARAGGLEDRQHAPGAGRSEQRDLPELVFAELDFDFAFAFVLYLRIPLPCACMGEARPWLSESGVGRSRILMYRGGWSGRVLFMAWILRWRPSCRRACSCMGAQAH